MKRTTLPVLVLLAGCLPSLAACGGDRTPGDAAREAERAGQADADGSTRVLGIEIEKVTREVREELATSNIDFGGKRADGNRRTDSDAEITPEGDLLIAGEPVAVDAAQRELLLEYRRNVTEVAMAGARIGLQGADLATAAMGEAFRGVMGGDTEGMDARIEAEAEKIKAEARKLCDHLEPLYESQHAIAASIPELAPYATMTRDDIVECREEGSVTIP